MPSVTINWYILIMYLNITCHLEDTEERCKTRSRQCPAPHERRLTSLRWSQKRTLRPSTNRMAPAIRLYCARRNDSQPLTAPDCCASIMLLTTHSCKRLVSAKVIGNERQRSSRYADVENGINRITLTAAGYRNKHIHTPRIRKERGVKDNSVLIVTIFSCQQRVRRREKIREQLTQVSGRKQHKYRIKLLRHVVM